MLQAVVAQQPGVGRAPALQMHSEIVRERQRKAEQKAQANSRRAYARSHSWTNTSRGFTMAGRSKHPEVLSEVRMDRLRLHVAYKKLGPRWDDPAWPFSLFDELKERA